MNSVGNFSFAEDSDTGTHSKSFAVSQLLQHGTPHVVVVTHDGTIVYADRRNSWRDLLAGQPKVAANRLPGRLARIVKRHHENPPVDDAATVIILDDDVVVSIHALDRDDLYACSLWRIQRARALETARRRYMLTNRECELLDRILHGESSAEIARTLSISLATVEWHTKRLLIKTDSQNRTQMATRTVGWLPDTT